MNLIYEDNSIGRYIQNIRRMSSAKRMSWIERMVKAGKICVQDNAGCYLNFTDTSGNIVEEFVDIYLEKMRILVDYLNTHFEDRWDMHIRLFDWTGSIEYVYNESEGIKFLLVPIIHYPHIHITSENESEHDIEDIFVSTEFTVTYKLRRSPSEYSDINISFGELKGFRSTLTFAEWNSGYAHSHLNMGSKPNASNILYLYHFCTGSGDIASFLPELRNGSYEFNSETLGMFFSIVESMLKWESISGVPHRLINNISEHGRNLHVPIVLPHHVIQSIFIDVKYLLESSYNTMPKFSFLCDGNKFDVVFNDEHLLFIKNYLISNNYHQISNVIIKKDGDKFIGYSRNHGDSSQSNNLVLGIEASFYFSGKEIKLNIKPIEGSQEINLNEYHIREEILKLIKDEFNNKVYKHQVLQRANAQNAV